MNLYLSLYAYIPLCSSHARMQLYGAHKGTLSVLILLFRLYKIIFRLYEILFRLYEIIFRLYEIIFRLYEILFRLYKIVFRLYEIIFRLYEILFRLYEIIISFVRNNISFVRNIISFVRNIISFVRNDLGMWLTNKVGTWVWHSLTGRIPGSDIHWRGRGPRCDTQRQGGDLDLTLTDRAGTWAWHSLTEWGPGSDTHWQGGDLGVTLTERAGSWVSECQTQVHALLVAGPDGSFVSTGACNLEVPCSNPGRAWYSSSWLCIYSAPNCSKAWNVHGRYRALWRTLEVIRNNSRA